MRRVIVTAAVFLLAGAVVNVAVAWGCALATGSDAVSDSACDVQLRALRRSMPDVMRARAMGNPLGLGFPIATADDLKWLRSRGWEPRPSNECVRWEVLVVERRQFGFYQRALVTWPDLNVECLLNPVMSPPAGMTWSNHPHGVSSEAGWPLRCVQDRLVRQPKGLRGYEHDSGLLVPAVLRTGFKSEPQYVPTGIMPQGFLLNMMFYAVVLWLLIPGPFALRRFIRVRRGLCPKCAYPRGESEVCSECGKAIPSRKVTAT